MSERYFDGERLSDCPYGCTDEGFVFIECRDPRAAEYHRHWLNLDDETIAKRFPVAVACACRKGQGLADQGLRRFRPERDNLHDRTHVRPTPEWQTATTLQGNPF